jgi:predicted DNA-binding protein
MARAALSIEFSKESIQALRELTERLEAVSVALAKTDPRLVGKAISREINRSARSAEPRLRDLAAGESE